MPVRAARSSMRGLAPWGFGGSGGRSGSTISHKSSVTSSLAMLSGYSPNGFVMLTNTLQGLSGLLCLGPRLIHWSARNEFSAVRMQHPRYPDRIVPR
jgi:hypothetical protein